MAQLITRSSQLTSESIQVNDIPFSGVCVVLLMHACNVNIRPDVL